MYTNKRIRSGDLTSAPPTHSNNTSTLQNTLYNTYLQYNTQHNTTLTLNTLSVDLLCIVLSYCDPLTVLNCRTVNKSFYKVTFQHHIWSNQTAVIYNDSFKPTQQDLNKLYIHDSKLQQLSQLGSITKLELLSNQTRDLLQNTPDLARNLESLHVEYTHPIYTTCQVKFINLHKLSFHSATWRAISSLRVGDTACSENSDKSTDSDNDSGMTVLSDTHCIDYTYIQPQLDELYITYDNGFDCSSIDIASYKCANQLHLSIVTDYKTPTLYTMLAQMSNLTTLSLTSNQWKPATQHNSPVQHIDNDTFGLLAQCENLHTITLTGNDVDAEYIADNLCKLQQLHTVHLGIQITEQNRRTLLAALQLLPKLHTVSLLAGISLDVHWLQTLTYIKLQCLNLHYISSLNHSAWSDIIDMVSLNHLTIHHCHLPVKTMYSIPLDIKHIELHNVEVSFDHSKLRANEHSLQQIKKRLSHAYITQLSVAANSLAAEQRIINQQKLHTRNMFIHNKSNQHSTANNKDKPEILPKERKQVLYESNMNSSTCGAVTSQPKQHKQAHIGTFVTELGNCHAMELDYVPKSFDTVSRNSSYVENTCISPVDSQQLIDTCRQA